MRERRGRVNEKTPRAVKIQVVRKEKKTKTCLNMTNMNLRDGITEMSDSHSKNGVTQKMLVMLMLLGSVNCNTCKCGTQHSL